MVMNVQYIRENGKPTFAVIPFGKFQEICQRLKIADENDENIMFPLEVSEMQALKGYSLIKAWRIYRGKTQGEMAKALGITQGAFSQIEKNEHNQRETLRRVADVLGVMPEQLTLDD